MTGLPRRPGPTVRTRVEEHVGDEVRRHEDRLATEEPLEVRLTWPGAQARRVWVTMRTPGHDFELAAGWVRHEGLLGAGTGLAGVAYCTDADLTREQELNVVTVTLDAAPAREPGYRHEGLSAGSSACGVCGADSVADALSVTPAEPWAGPLPPPDVVRRLPDLVREAQRVFDRTGGVHAAALARADGELLVVREDIGRHNAVDKVTGARLLAGEPVAEACLVVSGRAGFELVQKALKAAIPVMVSGGAASSLAGEMASAAGMTLYSFVGPGRGNLHL